MQSRWEGGRAGTAHPATKRVRCSVLTRSRREALGQGGQCAHTLAGVVGRAVARAQCARGSQGGPGRLALMAAQEESKFEVLRAGRGVRYAPQGDAEGEGAVGLGTIRMRGRGWGWVRCMRRAARGSRRVSCRGAGVQAAVHPRGSRVWGQGDAGAGRHTVQGWALCWVGCTAAPPTGGAPGASAQGAWIHCFFIIVAKKASGCSRRLTARGGGQHRACCTEQCAGGEAGRRPRFPCCCVETRAGGRWARQTAARAWRRRRSAAAARQPARESPPCPAGGCGGVGRGACEQSARCRSGDPAPPPCA